MYVPKHFAMDDADVRELLVHHGAGDLLLAVWRRVPLEVLTVDGDPAQAAAMIGLVNLD